VFSQLEGHVPNELDDQLTKYLTDAHSIEEQALAQLRAAPELAGDQVIAAAYAMHLEETEGHEARVRALLEARGAAPSRIKDAVMAVGGKGFVLFARSQPDTPGKLQAHSYSYEALELASYELLARVAIRAGDDDVADEARAIMVEESAMLDRLGATFDRATSASLAALDPDDLAEQLRKYLADAHAIEEQAIGLLERGPRVAGSTTLAKAYADHLEESREHARLIDDRLQALGGDPSSLKDAALRLGALNWSAFFRAQPDTPGKLAAFVYAFEHLEMGGYEQLKRVAERVGDDETVALVTRILAEEHAAADRIAELFDDAVTASLYAVSTTR
jgi:ferritin-like metal-binding protein YciE